MRSIPPANPAYASPARPPGTAVVVRAVTDPASELERSVKSTRRTPPRSPEPGIGRPIEMRYAIASETVFWRPAASVSVAVPPPPPKAAVYVKRTVAVVVPLFVRESSDV